MYVLKPIESVSGRCNPCTQIHLQANLLLC
jgi:hypothetical protein